MEVAMPSPTNGPINLNRARKARAAEQAKAQAAENRVKFGRTKGQRVAEQQDAARTVRLLDGKKRDEP
jgi:hypothetical protein